jgi:hypothetical protein
MNRVLRLVGLPLGLAILVWLVMRSDPAALFGVFPRIGWGFVAIVAARAATVVVDCGAWACLLPPRGRPSFALMLPLRWIAESINTTLPAAQIGGEVVRARLLQRRLDSPARGAASVAVDFSLSLLAQILFTLLGFVLLARLSAAAWCAGASWRRSKRGARGSGSGGSRGYCSGWEPHWRCSRKVARRSPGHCHCI